MTDASPGPDYWKAADGKWYPPQWEYHWLLHNDLQLQNAMIRAGLDMQGLGQQGWEMVNYTVQGTPSSQQFYWQVTCFVKRRIVRSLPPA